MDREILKKTPHLLGSAGMKFRLIADRRETFPFRVMGDGTGVSPGSANKSSTSRKLSVNRI
jgi:hypothetical protein